MQLRLRLPMDITANMRNQARGLLRKAPYLETELRFMERKLAACSGKSEQRRRRLIAGIEEHRRALRRLDAVLADMDDHPKLKDLLIQHYMDEKKLFAIARDLGYSERHTYRYLSAALNLFCYLYETEPEQQEEHAA